MKKVIVGMSGGVDSSVSALLLKEQGYIVEGLFMKNWEEDDNEVYCSAAVDLADASAVCHQLQIPLHTVNFSKEYWQTVFQYFLMEYQAGRTPNPDVLCNKEIKFKCFLNYAARLGADFIATGHYAQKKLINQNDSEIENFQLITAVDQQKDQTYFLYTLGQNELAKSLFPLGAWIKSEVRAKAQAAGFMNSQKKDSTGICFIGERKFKDFLERYLPHQPGKIETPDGTLLGEHDGLMYYTIGQRQGIQLGGKAGFPEAPWYVANKDLQRNVLIVVQNHQHPTLYHQALYCSDLHWVSGKLPKNLKEIQAKIRYRQQAHACHLFPEGSGFVVHFQEPQWAIAPGQSIVFYQNEVCLGGGVIQYHIETGAA